MDFYLKYNYNPFVEYKGQDGAFMKQMLKNRKEEIVNVAVKLGDMRVKQPGFKESVEAKSCAMNDMKKDF